MRSKDILDKSAQLEVSVVETALRDFLDRWAEIPENSKLVAKEMAKLKQIELDIAESAPLEDEDNVYSNL